MSATGHQVVQAGSSRMMWGGQAPVAGDPHAGVGHARAASAVGAWLELDSEVVSAESPAQFRLMLSRIAKAAGLTAGQIAVKANIPRSQAYALAKESPVLPRKPDQVRAFLQACTVSPPQVEEVMQLWKDLSVDDSEMAPGIARGDDLRVAGDLHDEKSENTLYGDIEVQGGNLNIHGNAQLRGHITVNQPATGYELAALARHVLNDERRTNRALRLLGRLCIVLGVLLGFLAYVLTLLPTEVVVQLVVGAVVVLGVAASVAGTWFAVRRATRRRSVMSGG